MNYTDIQNQFNRVIEFSQGIENPQTDSLFELWKKNKAAIIDAFGGKLIKEVGKVSFKLDASAKETKTQQFLTYLDSLNNYPLYRFFALNRDGFLTNRVLEDYKLGEGKYIHAGSKLVKSFKYFITDEELLEQVQNYASAIIQENKIEGTLCFSVHPLDFLSSSENIAKWRSCHSLDGEYRAGNLSYMCDSSTIVCYLKSDDNINIPNFPDSVLWNSKKWRCLLYLSDKWDCMFAGRQYPFFSSSALPIIREWMMDCFFQEDEENWSLWYNKLITNNGLDPEEKHWDNYQFDQSESFLFIGNQCYRMDELVIDPDDPLHYNDLLYSGCYIPYYMFKKAWRGCQRVAFHIGTPNICCLQCGGSNNPIESGRGTMLCDECQSKKAEDEMYWTCSCCGRRYYCEDGGWVDSTSEYVCPECEHSETFICEECGLRHWTSEHRTDQNGRWLCESCYKSEEEE